MFHNRIAFVLLLLLFSISSFAANQVSIVVKNSSGDVITRCVEFEEEALTVDTLIKRSGFKHTIADTDFGPALCFLHDEGNPDPNNCFEHPQDWFWNFFQFQNGAWESAPVGIGTATVTDGDMVGFAFGAFGETTLPELTPEEVCGITSMAGLVVEHSNGERIIRVVEFPGETITGIQLLERSDVEFVMTETSFGTAICSIDGEGQPQSDCFGDPEGRFWGLNVLTENGWESSMVGVGDTILYNGDVHGWVYSTDSSSIDPITFDQVFNTTSMIEGWAAQK